MLAQSIDSSLSCVLLGLLSPSRALDVAEALRSRDRREVVEKQGAVIKFCKSIEKKKTVNVCKTLYYNDGKCVCGKDGSFTSLGA